MTTLNKKEKGEMQVRNSTTIVVAGATGNLGRRFVNSILRQGGAAKSSNVAVGRARYCGSLTSAKWRLWWQEKDAL